MAHEKSDHPPHNEIDRGSFPSAPGDSAASGSSPSAPVDSAASGSSPSAPGDSAASGSSPSAPGDSAASGSSPSAPVDSVAPTFPASEPGSSPDHPAEQTPEEAAAALRQRQAFARTKWVVLLLVTLVSCALDQWSKHWAQEDLRHRPGRRVTVVEGYFDLAYVQNPGAAWGVLSDAEESFRKPFFLVVSLAAMVFIFFIHWRLEPGQHLLLFALSLVMSGALGNFIDRLRFEYVVDFIMLHWQDRFRWPTFNVADVAITAGVLLLFADMFITPILERRRQAQQAGGPPASLDR